MTSHVARLSEVCEINPRMPKSLSDNEMAAFLPMAAVSESGQIDFQEERPIRNVKKGYSYFERGDILVAKITPCFENGKATRTCSLCRPIGFGSTEFHVLRAGKEIDPSYLFHLVWNSRFRKIGASNMTGSAGQKRLPAEFLKRLEVPLPSLNEQRRMAAILDKADALRCKRKRALDLLDSLVHSVFNEISTKEDLARSRLSDFAKIMGGKRLPKGHDYCDEETRHKYLRVVDIQKERLRRTDLKNLRTETFKSISKYVVNKDDVVITIAGTIGVTLHIDAELAGVNLTENAAKIVLLDRNNVDPIYLAHALQSDDVQAQIRASTGQVTIGKLALFRIEALEIPLPSIDEQHRFSGRISHIRQLRKVLAKSLETADACFSSLQHRAFTGEL